MDIFLASTTTTMGHYAYGIFRNQFAHGYDIVIPETIGQYTGLKDCNGVEIYEGDIIEVRGRHKRVVVWDKIGYALMPCEEYHDKSFWVMNLQHPGEDWWDTFRDEIEVIGNIHDNPELLKGGEA